MHDMVLNRRRALRLGRRAFYGLQGEVAPYTVFVEGHSFAALAVEADVGTHCCHNLRFKSIDVDDAKVFAAEGAQRVQNDQKRAISDNQVLRIFSSLYLLYEAHIYTGA